MVELVSDFTGKMGRERFTLLSITAEHAVHAGLLPGAHNDPFDRMLIAQAPSDNMLLVSNEKISDRYGVRKTW